MDLKKHRLVIGAVVFVALLVVTFVVVRRTSEHRYDDPAVGERARLPELKRDRIDEIEIRRPNEAAIRLVKHGTSWRLAAPVDADASQSAVSTALDKLVELEVTGIAATRRENHARLEVDDAHAVRVIVRHGTETLVDLLIGAYKGGNTMVRVHGQDRVLAVEGSIKFAFNKEPKDWRDRTITSLAADDVREISFASTKGRFHFIKTGSDWGQAPGEAPLARFAPSKVQSLVASLMRVSAVDFGEPSVTREAAGIRDDGATVSMQLSSDGGPSQVLLHIGNARGEGDREYYMTREGSDVLFVISKYLADRMQPDGDQFQNPLDAGVPPPPAANPPSIGMPPGAGGGGQQIPPEVMEQLRRQLQQQGGGGGGPPH